eukprot:CAMPEP_0172519312 /NCGR_PEP_ID=MMETSP1066-20121228/291345_1 /TAXON_ID=671091 /ORGANISM="Coscinodiscus wailesii, Strain CCMP2513" /LENGTH=566 /DNA_ID=CAMNT_0013301879 /DNA_START=223 /DNA_END=1923 /DNA_ORIENTATION=+
MSRNRVAAAMSKDRCHVFFIPASRIFVVALLTITTPVTKSFLVRRDASPKLFRSVVKRTDRRANDILLPLHSTDNNNNDDDATSDGPVFYNDFNNIVGEDLIPAAAASDDTTTRSTAAADDALSTLLEKTAANEFRRNLQLDENWKKGNWKVRCFSLPRALGDDDDDTVAAPRVSKITHGVSDDYGNVVLVGRTDGSVTVLRLAEREEGKEENGEPLEIVARMRQGRKRGGRTTARPVSALLLTGEMVYVASPGGGVCEWEMIEEDGEASADSSSSDEMRTTLSFVREWDIGTYEDCHALLPLSSGGNYVNEGVGYMVAISGRGNVIVYDTKKKCIHRKISVSGCDGDAVSILSADVDHDIGVLYLGLGNGYVLGYALSDLVMAKAKEEPIKERFRFKAYEMGGVTALKCAGRNMMVSKRQSRGTEVGVLLTGGADGCLKQWDMIPRTNPELKLEHWPRLKTQRLQSNRAHTFNTNHNGAITAITTNGGSHDIVMTCSAEDGGILLHSPLEGGKELYRMEGFDDISSLVCVERSVLVTDGMGAVVCLHDFDVSMEELKGLVDFDEW